MRELVYFIAASIDGLIAGPDGQFDAFPFEGDHIQYLFEQYPDTIPTSIAAQLGIVQPGTRFGTVLMGANTYAVGQVESPYSHLEQIVFTSKPHAPASNLIFSDADPVETVRRLKQQPGADIWLCGGGNLASQLIDEIDRLVIKRNPIFLGDGIPLFGRTSYDPKSFALVDHRVFQSGVAISDFVRERNGKN